MKKLSIFFLIFSILLVFSCASKKADENKDNLIDESKLQNKWDFVDKVYEEPLLLPLDEKSVTSSENATIQNN